MNTQKARNHILLIVISIISLFCLPLGFVKPVFSQEGDEPLKAWKWYYYQRAYPFDTIPWSAYERAVEQREALLQSTGYQFPAPLRWEQIGPLPYAGIYSGRIAHVVYDRYDPQEDGSGRVIYVTGAAGGLWKTIDGGANWTKKSGNLPTLSAGAFAISYVNGNKILYFGTGQWNQFWGDGLGMRIFKSTDDGNTWTQIGNGLRPGTSISKIAVSPDDPNILFAATFHGLYKTVNGGALWTKIIPRPEDPIQELICSDVCFSPNGSRVYAVGPTQGRPSPWNVFDGIGYYRSDDGGNNFAPITDAGFPHPGNNVIIARTICAVSKAPGAEDLVWLVSYDADGSALDYFYKSTNGGILFTSCNVGSNNSSIYQLVLRPSDVNKDICFAGSQNLHKTINGGTTSGDWECVDGYWWMCNIPENQTTHPDFLALDFNPFYPEKVTAGNDGGVFRSDNSGNVGSWYSRNQNLGSFSLLWGLASSTYDASFVAGGLHDFTTFCYNPNAGPGSTNWIAAAGGSGDCGNVLASPFKSKHFVSNILTGNQNIYYSSNGTNFEGATGYNATSTASIEVEPFVYHPSQPGVVYVVRFNGVWQGTQQVQFRKSTDYGATWGGDEPWQAWRLFQRPNQWDATAPTHLAISQSDPNTIIMTFGNGSEFWMGTFATAKSRLIKSIDGGQTWEGIDYGPGPIVTGGTNGTPNRFFTDVEFDPKDPNSQEVYLTVSGYYPLDVPNGGHVFKSIDGGHNWTNISGSLPDIPVNDIMIHYTGTGTNDKELIIATDAGIYHSNAENIGWGEIANEFPKTPALHLDYNRLSGKLRANTWGRGGWEFGLDNTVYVQDKLYITDNVTLNLPIVVCPGGKLILGHSDIPDAMTIYFNNNSNITVMDGGEIDASTGHQITLTSQSGSWGGIEFQGTAKGTLKNCYFYNAPVTITVNGSDMESQGIDIENCEIHDGSVMLNNASNVYFTNNKLYVDPNYLAENISGISINYGYNINIYKNEIYGGINGIFAANASPSISQNTINTLGAGIGLYISYSADLRENNITSSLSGVDMYSSSPKMYMNKIYDSGNEGLYARGLSYPILRPTDDGGGQLIWDNGLNEFTTTYVGLRIDASYADIYRGRNKITAPYRYILGGTTAEQPYFAQENCWDGGAPDPNKFEWYSGPVYWDPYECNPPGGAGKSGDEPVIEELLDPPPPIIVDHGHGCIDTIKVTTGTLNLTADKSLFSQGLKNELLGNYNSAIGLYQNLIQNYQDSAVSINALKRILTCYDRLHSDTGAYNILGQYYLNLANNNQNDTNFYWTAKELAIKTQVRKNEYPSAINNYENVIAHTSDSIQIISSEVNIISTYMLMNSGGGDISYSGNLKYLKPLNSLDGFKMMLERLNLLKIKKQTEIPTVFSLSQNYPNPFNPLTKINFEIPKKSNVTLKVYDILGRLVKTLVNELKEPGYYTVQFDGSSFASGVYFYTIEAGDYKASKKMVLVK